MLLVLGSVHKPTRLGMEGSNCLKELPEHGAEHDWLISAGCDMREKGKVGHLPGPYLSLLKTLPSTLKKNTHCALLLVPLIYQILYIYKFSENLVSSKSQTFSQKS